eukprot:gene8289-biopygen15150
MRGTPDRTRTPKSRGGRGRWERGHLITAARHSWGTGWQGGAAEDASILPKFHGAGPVHCRCSTGVVRIGATRHAPESLLARAALAAGTGIALFCPPKHDDSSLWREEVQ